MGISRTINKEKKETNSSLQYFAAAAGMSPPPISPTLNILSPDISHYTDPNFEMAEYQHPYQDVSSSSSISSTLPSEPVVGKGLASSTPAPISPPLTFSTPKDVLY
jgi:hypothetical protein